MSFCVTSLAVSDKRITEWLSVICSLQNWGLVCWELGHTSGDVKSAVLCRSSSVLLRTRRALEAKVAGSLTDVWQQLFEQQDITVICTIHFHLWLHETTSVHRSPETQTETDTQEHVYQKLVRDVNELKQHRTEIWSATSEATLIKWQDCFNACLKVKSKHWTFAIMCFCVTVMTLKRTLLLLRTN